LRSNTFGTRSNTFGRRFHAFGMRSHGSGIRFHYFRFCSDEFGRQIRVARLYFREKYKHFRVFRGRFDAGFSVLFYGF
jgi:hypothetical protein